MMQTIEHDVIESGHVIRTIRGLEGVTSQAIYSPCERYRYSLSRLWDFSAPLVAFIGLNPSTATEAQNDPTITRCINFALRWKYGGMIMLNAFGFRSTDPRGLRTVDDPNGDGNDSTINVEIGRALIVVCCWGVHAKLHDRHQKLRELLAGQRLYHLGLTKRGYPRHPLYLPGNLKPEEWQA